MNDPEFKKMFHKAIFAVAVALVFAVPLFFIFKNKIFVTESSIIKDIENNKTIIVYVTEDNCSKCKDLKKVFNKSNKKYKELNKKNTKDYKKIITSLGIESSSIYTPTVIYIKKGRLVSYIVGIDTEEQLTEYLKNCK